MRLNTVEFLSFGEERLYAKERALVDLLRDELAAGRPCVVYVRQTATKDIQPRLEALIRAHVAEAVPYILKNTVSAERREAVIDAERGKGMNVLITNPELVKTGLDLVHSPTLIFYEITFNLGTMMQAAARAYRLNQTHRHCKTYYLFAQDTMEHIAVQLMSRKQRAAKLLTGEVGLTGLEALTEGESGFEEALLDAIATDERLVDPQALFTADAATHALDAEDFAYWNADTASDDESVVEDAAPTDWLADSAQTLGAVITPLPAPTRTPQAALNAYLETVHILHDRERLHTLQAALWTLLHSPSSTLGALHDTAHHPAWVAHITEWLERERLVFAGCEAEVAAQVIKLAQANPPAPEGERLPLPVKPNTPRVSVRKPKRRQLDLLAVPDDLPNTEPLPPLTPTHMENPPPIQLSLF